MMIWIACACGHQQSGQPPRCAAGRLGFLHFRFGFAEDYKRIGAPIRKGLQTDRDEMLRKLIDLQYDRNDIEFKRGTFRVRGDVVEILPSYENPAYRIEFFGDEIDHRRINPLTGELLPSEEQIFIYPAVHYVMPEDSLAAAVQSISAELDQRVMHLRSAGQAARSPAPARPHKVRHGNDAWKSAIARGIENYCRHLDGRSRAKSPTR